MFWKKYRIRILSAAILFLLILCAAGGLFWLLRRQPDFIGVEKGNGLTEKEAEQVKLSDISEEDWDIFEESNMALSQIAGSYSNEKDFIEPEDAAAVINAVAKEVDTFYKKGIIVYYFCDENGITLEYASGLTAYYEPEIEGYSSGGDNIDILTVDPFENDVSNETMTDTAFQYGNSIKNALSGRSLKYYKNEDVTLELLLSLPTSEFFLWNGHGGCLNVWGNQWPTLVTRQSLQGWQRNLKEDFWGTDVTACTVKIKGSGLYWAITPHFVETYIKMDQGMVYLSTCHSGQSNQLAAAFMNAGAKTVFVNVGNSTVKTWYTQELMKLVLECMSGSYDDIFHTSGEALQLANDIFARSFDEQGGVTVEDKKYPTLEDFVNGLQNGVHTEVIGDELYTLCPCIRGTVSFEDNLSESSISSIIKTLSVELDSAEGEFLKSTTLTGEKFYFNDLEPGTYQITLYSDGKPVGRSISVEVTEHRYTNAELFYELPVLLEGYVYNADGEPLSDVTVSAELTGNPEAYSSETKSDENGYYCIEVFGVNTYTLSYDRSGYSSLQNELNVTSKMYNHAQKGAKNKLEDVILMKGGNCGDNLIWTLDSDGVLKISGVGKMEQHGSGNREWPNTVQSVVIEEGVTSIGAFSFYDLANLTSVTLPDSLERIEKYAFTYCSSLQEIILPENVAFIGEAAFKDCKSLRTIIIPEKISTLEKNVFSGCTSLTDIHLPDGLETISHSFYGCSSLTQIALPESLTSLSSGAFNECTSLTDVYYEGSLQEWETLTKDWSGGLITYYNDRLKNASVHCLG